MQSPFRDLDPSDTLRDERREKRPPPRGIKPSHAIDVLADEPAPDELPQYCLLAHGRSMPERSRDC